MSRTIKLASDYQVKPELLGKVIASGGMLRFCG
jgi:hypothetical protein